MKQNDRRDVIKSMGAAALLPLLVGQVAQGQAGGADGGIGPETVYELRVYHLNPGMQPKIVERFGKYERAIFKRCGMQPVAYWTALDGPALLPGGGGTLIYILRHRSRAAADAQLGQVPGGPRVGRAEGRDREGWGICCIPGAHVYEADRFLAAGVAMIVRAN